MQTTEQHFPVVLFIMLYKVVLTFKAVSEIKCDHSNARKRIVLCIGAVYSLLLFSQNEMLVLT